MGNNYTGIAAILLISLLIWLSNRNTYKLSLVLVAISLKIIVSLIVYHLYKNLDFLYIYGDAIVLTKYIVENPELAYEVLNYHIINDPEVVERIYEWPISRHLITSKIIILPNVITGCNPYLSSVIIGLVNLSAGFYFLKKIWKHLSNFHESALIVILMIPSVVFNTSGFMKESIVMSCMYIIAGFLIALYNREIKMMDIFLLIIGIYFLKVKFYYYGITIPVAIAWYVSTYLKSLKLKLVIIISVVAIGMFLSQYVDEFLSYDLALQSIIETHIANLSESKEGYAIPFHFEKFSISEFVKNSPLAVIYGFFGPFIWDVKNVLMLYVSIENTIFLLLCSVLIYSYFNGEINFNLHHATLIIYSMFLSAVITFTTPNFGTVFRYRVVFIAFMYIFVMSYVLPEKYKSFIKSIFVKNG